MFKTLLLLTLQYDGGELDLERTVHLPFIPFPGLFIEETIKPELDPVISSVSWILKESQFIATCKPLKRDYNRDHAISVTANEGWTLTKGGDE